MKNMADRIFDHYERQARDWDADRNLQVTPWNDKPWRDRFVAALPRAASVLDLGCGSGFPVAKYMAERGLLISAQLTGSPRYSRYGVSTSSIHFMKARTRRDRLLRCATTSDTGSGRRWKSGMISTSAPLSKYRPIPKRGA